ncbi:MAG: hypothetical protein RL417_2093 [Pseudomonadota bacterium]|jgi:8-oxo-dGTP pyrophosphatase MutT (NUDIX family)
MNSAARAALLDALEGFTLKYPRRSVADTIRRFVETEEQWWCRHNTRGHITASAWIISPDRDQAVLVHHRKLLRWLQPGGHIDGDASVFEAALREAREESGLTSLQPLPSGIFDIDIHTIPARPDFPAHDHLDIRFALEGDPTEPPTCSAESNDVRWWPLHALSDSVTDTSVLRMVELSRSL